MNNIKILICFFLLLSASELFSQSRIGIYAGLNSGKLSGDSPGKFKYVSSLNLAFGLAYDLQLKEDVYLSFQTSYANAGSKMQHPKVIDEEEDTEIILLDSGSDTNVGIQASVETAKSLFLIFKEVWDLIKNFSLPAIVIDKTSLKDIPSKLKLIKKNILLCLTGYSGNREMRVIKHDLTRNLPQNKLPDETQSGFDLIFADPPYSQNISFSILEFVNNSSLLTQNGLLIVEERHSVQLPSSLSTLELIDRRVYGETAFCFYRSSCTT